MTETGSLSNLWRYPASSLAGEERSAIKIGLRGVVGDRLYGLVDVASGAIARPDGDRKWHPVARIRTRLLDGDRLEVATRDGEWLAAPGRESDEAVSDFLGFHAAIRPLDGEAAHGIASASVATARYAKAPIHLLTTASLARLKALHAEGDPDPRRFRPNILVDMPEVEGHFPETEWIGRRIAIGEVELTISDPCRRCGFTIIAQDGIDYDPGILRSLVRHNRHNMGVYCTVDRPGRVEVGDGMRLL